MEAVRKGVSNIERHVVNTQQFGLPVIVALNRFITDTDAEVEAVKDILAEHGVELYPVLTGRMVVQARKIWLIRL